MQDTKSYNDIVRKLSNFFWDKGYLQVDVQSRLSITAACEDPSTISMFNFAKRSWPLPQTGQMWLEAELLKNPDYKGVFCISTSYRNEPNPIEGRHDLIFPMFEFEGRGNFNALLEINEDICQLFDFGIQEYFSYARLCDIFDTKELTHEHEEEMYKRSVKPVFLTEFPESTHPFWNMKESPKKGRFNKCDVILGGMETIGSAERETDPNKMRERFYTMSDGKYAELLIDKFGDMRVKQELEEYLALPMSERFGAGMGIGRMASALNRLR